MSKISNTLDNVGGNLSRPTQFSAIISPPSEVSGGLSQFAFDVLCKNIAIPTISMQPIEMSFKGHSIQYPGRVNQAQTMEVTLYLDEKHQVRNMLSDWISGIDERFYAVVSEGSAAMTKSRNFFGSMVVEAYNFKEDSVAQSYLIENIYPISVSAPNFDSAAIGEVNTISVTFALLRFVNEPNNSTVFDNHDSLLDVFGKIPNASYNTFSDLEGVLNTASNAWGTVNHALDSMDSLKTTIEREM